jgi:predicted Fe-S protein YdhL (DUF1289 family)
MVVDGQHEGDELPAARSVQAQHPDTAVPVALIAQRWAAFYGQASAWPASMIGRSESEFARWWELRSHPRAAVWAEAKQEYAVAALVRVEHRTGRGRRRSPQLEAELVRLRHELGLTG